jgi:CubicO group peptidase (beta-lactamase class C family)
MTRSRAVSEWINLELPQLVAEHGVPGAQVAALVDGDVVDAAAGVLNVATAVPVTTDAVFQIGSITKVWTATLVQQLANEGLLDLDRSLCEYLPEFQIADKTASATVTTRQLLCHTAGFEGDLFTDTGSNDDAVEKYVGTLADVAQLFPPGNQFSYCNSGYVVLGRLVEVLQGKPFNTVLRERLITALGLEHVATNVGEAILERPAVGHLQVEPLAPIRPAPVWSLPPSTAPAGSTLAMRARSLLGFVQMHLSDTSFSMMRQPQVVVPDLGMGGHWGLGWMLFDYPGGTVIGHDGGTLGQSAYLRVVPEAGIAVTLLTNGGDVLPVFRKVFGHLLAELAGVDLPPMPVPPTDPLPVDADRASGTYRSTIADHELSVDADGRAWLRTVPRTEAVKGLMPEATVVEVVRLRNDALITVEPQEGMHRVIGLLGSDACGRVKFLHDGRATARVPK